MGNLWQDLRFGLRLLAARPGFAAIAILTLALGIGANTTIFSLMNVLFLKSLPVWHPEELLQVRSDLDSTSFTNPIWEELRDHQDAFSGVFAWGSPRFNLSDAGEARFVNGLWVSGEFFSTLGVQPILGRTLTPEDDRPGAAPAAVLSFSFWQSEYGGQIDVIGKTVRLDGHPFAIAGVTPREFFGVEVGRQFDVAIPIATEPLLAGEFSKLHRPQNWWLTVMGRPKPGLSARQVSARLYKLSPQVFAASVPPKWEGPSRTGFLERKLSAIPAGEGISYLRQMYRPALLLLLGVTGLVLLIACANVANLLLARASARQKEIGVRLAVGASRARLVRQLVTESLVLGLAGAGLGMALAAGASRLLASQVLTGYFNYFDLSADFRVGGFTAGAGLLTTLLFGLAPALIATRMSLSSAMKDGGSQGAERRGKLSLGPALVVAQVCVSVVLVAGAGLLLRTFRNLVTLDPGFDSAHVLVAKLDVRKSAAAQEHRNALFDKILARVRTAPGVIEASTCDVSPISGSSSTTQVHAEGSVSQSSNPPRMTVYTNLISPEYFRTMNIPLLAGRDFRVQDGPSFPRVAVVNETLAHKLFGGENPVGKRVVKFGIDAPIEVIGLVKDAKYQSLREKMYPTLFTPFSQYPIADVYRMLEVRSEGNPATLIPAVREAISTADPEASVSFVLLKDELGQSLAQERLMALLSSAFGSLALLLSALGLYGLISYAVARRRREFGIRIALGASRLDIVRLVLSRGLVLAVGGAAAGVLCATLASQLVKSFLYGVEARDPLTLFGVCALLIAVAAAACYVPARRATKVDPAAALRAD